MKFATIVLAVLPAALMSAETNTISQYGITWYLADSAEFGKYANGDYWVLGPVRIDSVTPTFDGNHHGWEVNPTHDGRQGFDSRIEDFDRSLVPLLPYDARPVASIVKVISYFDGACGGFNAYECCRTAAVLTVVSTEPSNGGATQFRPPFVGNEKPAYSTTELRPDLLPKLSHVSKRKSLEWVESRFKRVQLDHKRGRVGRSLRPIDNYQNETCYGPDVGNDNVEGAFALMFNDATEAKLPALINYVQAGLDAVHEAKSGRTWTGQGAGIEPGFRITLVFAAAVLDNDDLKGTVSTLKGFSEYEYLQPNRMLPDRAVYGTEKHWTEEKYWQYIVDKDNGSSVSTAAYRDPYGYIDGELPETRGYAFCCFPTTWKGSALAAHLFPAMKALWNNDLLLDYADRYVNIGRWTQPDPCAPHDGNMDNYGVTFGPDPNDPSQCIRDRDLEYYNGPHDFKCREGADCGRYPEFHGTQANEHYYKSNFINQMWEQHRGASCYDGICSGDETPDSCPYDCDGYEPIRGGMNNGTEHPTSRLTIANNPLWTPAGKIVVTFDDPTAEISIHGANGAVLKKSRDGGRLVWNGVGRDGKTVPNGVCYVCVKADAAQMVAKLIVLN